MSAMDRIAIIGLDAQFSNQQSEQNTIDKVERALYVGKELAKAHNTQDLVELSPNSCQQAVERMAKANNLTSADINLVIVSENGGVSEDMTAEFVDVENILIVSSLAEAIIQIDLLIAKDKVVALVGLNLDNQLSHNITEKINSNDEQEISTTISFDQTFNNYQHCNGLAALLFSSTSFAASQQCYIYSWLKGFAVGAEISTTVNAALQNAQVSSEDIGLLEVSSLSEQKASRAETLGLMASYNNDYHLNTAISCARSVTGEGAGFSQVLGLLRTVIALQQRYIPAISDWQQPQATALTQWQTSNFYFPTESRPWYPNKDNSAQFAAYSCLASDQSYCHLVLQETKLRVAGEKHPASDIRHNGFIACSDLHLVLIGGDNEAELLTRLTEIENDLSSAAQKSVKEIASSCFESLKRLSANYTVSLICESQGELLKEIQSAKTGMPIAFKQNKEWRTPKGSYFTATPVNVDAKGSDTASNNVSFLYPGIGATYVGLGRDLFHLFPEIHQDVADLADDIGASLKDTLLNPRTIIRPDFKALKQLDLNLRGNLADIAEAGVGFACVFTKVFENVFKVKADYATGYSMGEVSMYAALGAWKQPGLMSARLANSDTFNQRLCGDLLTLREHWGLVDTPIDEVIWETYTIKATLGQVIAASEDEDRVYCTIINTPDSLLLAGYPEDCLKVIKKLGVRAMPLNMANAIHSAPANIEYDDMVELYTMAVTNRLKTKMYSSSCYLPVPQLSKAIAHSVAKCLCDRVDFPRLINTLHDKGARVFIEMGPGRSLCSWVDKILDFNDGEQPRISVPVNAKGTSDELTYVRALAKLISHGVKLDIETLFNGSIIVQN